MNSLQTCYVFVSCTNSQNNTIDDILKNVKGDQSINNSVLITTKGLLLPKCIKDKNIFIFDGYNNIARIFYEIINRRTVRNFYSFVAKKTKKYPGIELFIPHFINLTSNYLALNLKKQFSEKKIIVSIYPDGIAQLYNSRVRIKGPRNSTVFAVLTRFITGLMIGIRYRPFLGSIIDPFKIIDRLYTYFPSLALSYSARKIIQISVKKSIARGTNVLIVGSDRNMEKNIYKKYIHDIAENHLNIYYKKHPSIEKDPFIDIIKKEALKIIIINEDCSIKKIVENYGIKTVVCLASISTALIEMKLIFGDTISCIIYSYDTIRQKLSVSLNSDFDKINSTLNIIIK